MSQFKPIMVAQKINLDTVIKKSGQYIVVLDAGEVYIDKLEGDTVVRKKTSQNVYVQDTEPLTPNNGDIWFVTTEENIDEKI